MEALCCPAFHSRWTKKTIKLILENTPTFEKKPTSVSMSCIYWLCFLEAIFFPNISLHEHIPRKYLLPSSWQIQYENLQATVEVTRLFREAKYLDDDLKLREFRSSPMQNHSGVKLRRCKIFKYLKENARRIAHIRFNSCPMLYQNKMIFTHKIEGNLGVIRYPRFLTDLQMTTGPS